MHKEGGERNSLLVGATEILGLYILKTLSTCFCLKAPGKIYISTMFVHIAKLYGLEKLITVEQDLFEVQICICICSW